MKNLFLFLFIALPYVLNAQISFELKGVIDRKISSSLKEGQEIEFKSIEKDGQGYFVAKLVSGDNEEFVDIKMLETAISRAISIHWSTKFIPKD